LLIASIDKAREIGIDWWETDPFLSSHARERELEQHARERELEQDKDQLRERLARLERLMLAPPQEADQEHTEVGQRSNTAPASVLDQQGREIAELKQPMEQAHEDEGQQAPERAPQLAEQPQATERAPQLAEQPQATERAPQPTQQPHAPERASQPAAQPAEQPQALERAPQLAEQPHTPERAPQPAAAQAPQPAAAQAPQPAAAQSQQPAGAAPLVDQALQEHIAQAIRPIVGELRERMTLSLQPTKQDPPAEQRGEEQEQPQTQERA